MTSPDGNGSSVAALANSMNEKFQQVIERFSQLELKVDRILANQNDRTACSSEKVERIEVKEPSETNTPGIGHQGFTVTQMNSSLHEERNRTLCVELNPTVKANLIAAEVSLQRKQRMTQALTRKCSRVSASSNARHRLVRNV